MSCLILRKYKYIWLIRVLISLLHERVRSVLITINNLLEVNIIYKFAVFADIWLQVAVVVALCDLLPCQSSNQISILSLFCLHLSLMSLVVSDNCQSMSVCATRCQADILPGLITWMYLWKACAFHTSLYSALFSRFFLFFSFFLQLPVTHWVFESCIVWVSRICCFKLNYIIKQLNWF